MSKKYSLKISIDLPTVRESKGNSIEIPETLFACCGQIVNLAQEALVMASLDAKCKIIDLHLCSLGGIASANVDPRVLFRYALLDGAVGIAVIHNHPSGDSYPSEHDRLASKRIGRGCEALGLRYLDFMIVGKDGFFSFMNADLISGR